MFKRRKMTELVLYIASRSTDDNSFGRTKLRKVLFFADNEAFLCLGHSITGARYIRLPHGPVPDQLSEVQNDLARAGDAVEHTYPGAYQQYVLEAKREPDLTVFSEDELEIIDRVIEENLSLSATKVSEKSHREIGWLLAETSEEIPYEAYYVKRRISGAALEAAKAVAAKL